MFTTILHKKFKPLSPHILKIYIWKKVHNITSTFGQPCYLPLFRWILTIWRWLPTVVLLLLSFKAVVHVDNNDYTDDFMMKMVLMIALMMIAMMMMTMTTKLLRSRWFCQEKYFLLNTFDQQPPRRKGAQQINIKKWSSGKQQVRYQKYEKELGVKFIGRKRSLSFLSSAFVIFVFNGKCGCILCIGLLLLHYPLAGLLYFCIFVFVFCDWGKVCA